MRIPEEAKEIFEIATLGGTPLGGRLDDFKDRALSDTGIDKAMDDIKEFDYNRGLGLLSIAQLTGYLKDAVEFTQGLMEGKLFGSGKGLYEAYDEAMEMQEESNKARKEQILGIQEELITTQQALVDENARIEYEEAMEEERLNQSATNRPIMG